LSRKSAGLHRLFAGCLLTGRFGGTKGLADLIEACIGDEELEELGESPECKRSLNGG
jgi:hypothetical protein